MPRISEVGYPPEVYFDVAGKRQRLGEEIRKIKHDLRHWSKPDQANAWAKIQSLEWLDSELERLENRRVDQIRIADFDKLQADANRRWYAETIRARNRRNAEIQIELNAIQAETPLARSREDTAALTRRLNALRAELVGQTD